MKFKRFTKAYFVFSKKERNASIILLFLIAVSIMSPFIYRLTENKNQTRPDYKELSSMFSVKEVETNDIESPPTYKYAHQPKKYDEENFENADSEIQRRLFYFDPNKISADEWELLGISKNIIQRIVNYRSSGGIFKKPDDLLKIYGFGEEDYHAISTYITIDTVQIQSPQNKNSFTPAENDLVIEINSATEDDFIAIGFSSLAAKRIINFRNGVGGIYSLEQMKQIFGLTAEDITAASSHLQIDTGKIKMINLNTISADELKLHSYISDELAVSIISYRDSSGRFVSVNELMKVPGMYKSLFEKLKPYLKI